MQKFYKEKKCRDRKKNSLEKNPDIRRSVPGAGTQLSSAWLVSSNRRQAVALKSSKNET
jgi:hypothetical protein